MKKTNFTLCSLIGMMMFGLGLFSVSSVQAQCALACNNSVQVSVSPDANACATNLNLDMLLEGNDNFYLFDPAGTCQGSYGVIEVKKGLTPIHTSAQLSDESTLTSFASHTYLGQTLTTKVSIFDGNDQLINSCWGSVTVEDKLGPAFDCSAELRDKAGNVLQAGDNFTITCDVDPALITAPTAVDNCDPSSYVYLQGEVSTGDQCNTLTLTRTYGSTDVSGNQGNTCVITINITQPTIEFPDDITWSCQQYAAYSNVIEPTALHPLILANAADIDAALLCCIAGAGGDDILGVDPYSGPNYWLDGEDLDISLDPRYEDNIDNPITDSNPACGTATAETDTDSCRANFSYMIGCTNDPTQPFYPIGYLTGCDLNPGGHVPNILAVPVYQPAFAPPFLPTDIKRGLEDADVLEATGSGEPNVASSDACNFSVTYRDQRVEACPGLGTDGPVFKILRTWTVLNWCTGQTMIDVQVIKVLDRKAPEIVFGDDYDDELESNQYSTGPHPSCASSGLLDVPSYTDDCTGVTDIRVFTPAGEAIAVENGGQIVGFRIPAPYLPMGNHTVTYQVSDACGNTTSFDKLITVIDGIPPVNICREITQVALSSEVDGITVINPEHFDEGTYDNCGPVYFKVRRMEPFGCDRANVDTQNEIRNPNSTSDDREWFDDKVKFCCADIGDSVQVILRAYDVDPGTGSVSETHRAANANDCMVQVLIEDKSRPTCVAPKDVWTTCDEVPDNLDLEDIADLTSYFGEAIAFDNCDATIEELTPNVDVDLCGVGTVTRRFRAEDAYGNRSLGSCTQTIMIMPVTSYTITLPGDFQEECDDASPATVEYEENGCDLLAVNIEDHEFPASTLGECKKIIRNYQVINWCEYDGFSDALVLPRLDINNDGRVGDGNGGSTTPVNHSATNQWESNGDIIVFVPNPLLNGPSTGYYSYEQHIKIYDNTAPELSYDGDTEFCGGDRDEDPCTGQVDIEPTIDELCTGTSTEWELDLFSDEFLSADDDGDGNYSDRLPLGTHTIRFYVSDECGNISQLDITFEVIDCKAPTPVCYNGLSIDVMPLSGMVEIWASDYDASSFDYCHPIKYAINRVTDTNNDGFITSDDYLTTVPQYDSVQFTCADAGNIVTVQLWVGEVSNDDVNNWDYCVSFMEVQDNNGVCSTGNRSGVTGNIKTDAGANVANVQVTVSGDMSSDMMTANDGAFEFATAAGNDITVTPMRTDDIRNGVSTFDLALISKHILNVQPFTSPYKIIAADANNSKTVTTLDLIAIRKVILHVTNDFPTNTSWRFVDKDQVFTGNPLNEVIRETKSFNDIAGIHAADFVAVKVGDVNGDAEPQDISSIDNRTFNGTFYLNTQDVEFEAGDRVEATFTGELATALGYQFTMNFNTKMVELTDVVEATASKENFGLTMADNGIVTASWNGTTSSNEAFTLVFTAKAAGTLSDALTVSSEYTKAEAYVGGGLKNIAIDFGTTETAEGFALYQNTPNPFNGETTIGFNLPKAAAATLTVSDVSGKVLQVVEGNYTEGYNVVTLNSSSLSQGVLYYQLDTDNFTATKKMIIIE